MSDQAFEVPEEEFDQRPPRVPDASKLIEVGDRAWILPDHERTPHVPNVGIVVGERSTLVVESGMGIANGERVLEIARDLGEGRPLFLTASHFHPEHGLGAQPFVGQATIVLNGRQREELFEKCQGYVELFSTFTPAIAEALAGVELVSPDVIYTGELRLDLGGRIVELSERGDGHTRGDQIVVVPDGRIVFAGDLVEERFFAILPDEDSDGDVWIERLEEIEALEPAILVPGHGALGGVDLAATARGSLEQIRDQTASLAAERTEPEGLAAAVEADQIARYPDWGNRDWIRPAALSFLRDRS